MVSLVTPVPLDWYSGAVLSLPTAFDVDSVAPPNTFLSTAPEVFDGNHPR
jgi:hypothetical protein